jgi:hypothetical protein
MKVDFLPFYVYICAAPTLKEVKNMNFLTQLITFDSAPINLLVCNITTLPNFFLSDTVESQAVATYNGCN